MRQLFEYFYSAFFRGHAMTRFSGPPVEYLRDCSSTSLRYFEMSKLEHVANLRRELAVLLDEMMEESALALFARWMLEGRSLPSTDPAVETGANSPDSRKAKSLLAEFIYGAAGTSDAADPPGEAAAHRGDPGHSSDVAASEHASPRRSGCREPRPPERRPSRPGRAATRSSQATH